LLHGKAVADIILTTQLQQGARQVAPCISLDSAQASSGWLRQLCVVLQDAYRCPSWRGVSAFHRLPKCALWGHIFSFLVPKETKDMNNTIALVIERVIEHATMCQELLHAAVYGRAWHMLSCARYVSEVIQEEEELEASIFRVVVQVIRDNNPKHSYLDQQKLNEDLARALNKVEMCWLKLGEIQKKRSPLFVEAGRAFLAAKEYSLATEAFKEAVATSEKVCTLPSRLWMIIIRLKKQGDIVLSDWYKFRELWEPVWIDIAQRKSIQGLLAEQRALSRGPAVRAGMCWLQAMDATRRVATISKRDALLAAELLFIRAGCVPTFGVCQEGWFHGRGGSLQNVTDS